MNALSTPQKIAARHRERQAFIYVRQSTLAQVRYPTASTARHYDLSQRAQELGWDPEQIRVLDEDQGQSAASATGRDGFATLIAEVGLGHAGAVFRLEVSRLARSCSDWYSTLLRVGAKPTVRVLPSRVEVCHAGKRVACHARSYDVGVQRFQLEHLTAPVANPQNALEDDVGVQRFQLEHYLDVFDKKPGALAGSRPLAQYRAERRCSCGNTNRWASTLPADGTRPVRLLSITLRGRRFLRKNAPSRGEGI